MKLEFLESGSPDCPLIRLYDFDNPAALWLTASIRALAGGPTQHIPLHDQSGINPVQGCQLDLRLGSHNGGIVQTSPNAFECVLTSEGWAKVADLIEPFCRTEDGKEQYQWLNEDGPISLLLSQTGRW